MKITQNKHYKKVDKLGNEIETINYVQTIMGDKFQYGCWFNILKYPIRFYDKHDTPIADIKKVMHYCLFMLNDLNCNVATENQDELFELFEKIDGGSEYTIPDFEEFEEMFKSFGGFTNGR